MARENDPDIFRVAVEETDGGRTVIALSGEFDLTGADRFRAAVENALAAEPAAIAVDLSSLTFIDSSGMREVVQTTQQADQAGVKMSIVPGPPRLHRLFELTGLANWLPFVE